jgi:hypothetical protein
MVSLGIDSRCLAASLFCKEVVRLISKSGLLFTALYLKQCSSSLQMAYGGVKKPPELLPLPISLTRNAYPRIIPAYHIRIIYRKDDRADLLVKCYLSFFSLSKVIILAKRVDKNTFKSIVTPIQDMDRVLSLVSSKEFLPILTHRYLPFLQKIPIHQGISWVPTWKSLPSDKLFKESVRKAKTFCKKKV